MGFIAGMSRLLETLKRAEGDPRLQMTIEREVKLAAKE
jgi:hypothetical protein